MKKIEELAAYEIREHRRIDDVHSDGYLLRHRKTGARIVLMPNEDENKVFCIGFRTPPADSTGVAHIIEHTVLCGSREFPIKDPFLELAKGSLNTFLNAITYPDKTIYPVASCNDADFQNLMHVYLDAVFHPNIYQTERIFRQEGWRYEMETPESELTLNGVVYNEMKGAFSSADEVLSRKIKESLFPDSPYGRESGGDPEVIPALTYEQYLDFHRCYYHPSNSYIYLYGDMDMAEKLEFLDAHYLSEYDALDVDSQIPIQQSFTEVKHFSDSFPILESESERDNTYLTRNWSVGESLDPDIYVGFEILDDVLCSAPGAPLKKALIEQGIGSEVYSEFEGGIRQPIFSIVAKNANQEDEQAFLDTIDRVLRQQVKDGIDRRALLGAINSEEFKFREADFGRFPKGLLYGIQILDGWLYDDTQPWTTLELLKTFASMRERVQEGRFFEELIERYLLNNSHGSVLILTPEKGLTERRDEALREKLAAYREQLSREERSAIAEETAALKAWQDEPDAPEQLAKIPLLSVSDLRKEADPFRWEERKDAKGRENLLFHDINTNGISYMNFIFRMDDIPERFLTITHILKAVLGMMDTAQYDYGTLYNEINIRTGGISAGVSIYTDARDRKKQSQTFEVTVKALKEQQADAFDLVREILMTTRFDDAKRLKEILEEYLSGLESRLSSSGHQSAAIRAGSYGSRAAAFSDRTGGIAAYRHLSSLVDASEQPDGLLALIGELQQFAAWLFRPERLLLDFTGSEEDLEGIPEKLAAFADSLHSDPAPIAGEPWQYVPEKKNEAFKTAGQVQYVARCGNFEDHGLRYHGSLRVLRSLMGLDYLWKNIRVLGGAYGCMSSFGRNGDSFFVSYRDPNLRKTLEVYDGAVDYLRHFEADERTMTQFIIGAVGELDMPKTPSAKGAYGLQAYMTHVTMEQVQQYRDEMLATDVAQIRRLADYVDAALSDGFLCVVGGAEAIDQDKALFDTVEPLIQG